ncbi:MAG: small, acid-soluble spore protein, alpha/beta type [Bacillota bacterium]
MANNNNELLVKNANPALERLKFEVASQVGVPLKQGYNGDLPAREAGKVGGQMVKRMIALAEQSLGGTSR